jgi:mRNA interferase MazF
VNYFSGEIVLIRFPFTDLAQTKQRPGLVLAVTAYSKQLSLVTIAMMTSQIDSPEIKGDFVIQSWKDAGLLHPTKVDHKKLVSEFSNHFSKLLS